MAKKRTYSRLIEWPDYTAPAFSVFAMFRLAWKALGKSLIYMQYMYASLPFGEQPIRVHALCERFAKLDWRRESKANKERWRRLLSDIADEIENQC